LVGGDVVEIAGAEAAAEDLVDEPGFGFDGLPLPNFGHVTSTIGVQREGRAVSGEASNRSAIPRPE
jgi:hypothetical protein